MLQVILITFALAVMTFLITNLTANENYWGVFSGCQGAKVMRIVLLAPIELLGFSLSH
jgi:F-type H+-transporting ATPase subunit a